MNKKTRKILDSIFIGLVFVLVFYTGYVYGLHMSDSSEVVEISN